MKQLDHVWNHRMGGVSGAISLAVASCARKLCDSFTTMIVRRNFHKTGIHVFIQRGIYYQHPSHIRLGSCVTIGHHAMFTSETKTGELEIGDGVTLAEHCWIDFSGGVRIGANSLLSRNVSIETHDHGLDPHQSPEYRPLTVGANVWVGMNSIILAKAETIGDNAVIAAGSVVTKPISGNCIVAGVPARVIGNVRPAAGINGRRRAGMTAGEGPIDEQRKP